MITEQSLRETLKDIFGIDDEHLRPISKNWFLPTVDNSDKVGTWIGYRILNKEPYARASQTGVIISKPMKVRFRLSFVGPQSEELADQTILWEDRLDVTAVFENHMNAQINYMSRTAFTYPIRNGGFNDELCWVVDFSAQTSYDIDTKQVPWLDRH